MMPGLVLGVWELGIYVCKYELTAPDPPRRLLRRCSLPPLTVPHVGEAAAAEILDLARVDVVEERVDGKVPPEGVLLLVSCFVGVCVNVTRATRPDPLALPTFPPTDTNIITTPTSGPPMSMSGMRDPSV